MERSNKKQQFLTVSEAYHKAAAFCNYQERSFRDLRIKFREYGLTEDETDELIMRLSEEKLVDEERFACAYARGRHNLKKWGRNKIRMGLKSKEISEYCIKKGLAEIDPDEYWKNLLQLLEKKNRTEKEKHPRLRRQKLLLYLFSRGYENDLANMALDELQNQKEE
ncbi:MAG: RecX family transcriptional regulator [Sphingobacteriales bacterium]|nr:MAG: RecX family transcriptional regulator [Sphingobacteriales bacterium]